MNTLIFNFFSLVGLYFLTDKNAELNVFIVCSLALVCGNTLGIYALRGCYRSLFSISWKNHAYKLIDSHVTREALNVDGIRYRYTPVFKVEYLYEGKRFIRDSCDLNLHLNKVFSTPSDAIKYLDQVKRGLYGSHVYVNPANPEEAFLRSGITRDQVGMLIFAALLVILPYLTVLGIIEWQ